MSDLLRYCEAEQPWCRELLDALVQLESPSDNKTAVDRCGDELARRLAAVGAVVQRCTSADRGAHVRAEFAGASDRQILLLGHFDTVWPVGTIASMPLEERAGRLHGPGVFDMKGGIATAAL